MVAYCVALPVPRRQSRNCTYKLQIRHICLMFNTRMEEDQHQHSIPCLLASSSFCSADMTRCSAAFSVSRLVQRWRCSCCIDATVCQTAEFHRTSREWNTGRTRSQTKTHSARHSEVIPARACAAWRPARHAAARSDGVAPRRPELSARPESEQGQDNTMGIVRSGERTICS